MDTSTLTGLVSQYSPSGEEGAASAWLVDRMSALGFTRSFVDQAGNAVGLMGEGSRQVLLLGHIDTVPGEIEVREEDGLLHGRGSVDAKGPLACFVGFQFVVIGAVEEERSSEGARHILPLYKPEFAVIGEPNRWERIALGYKGSAWADVTVRLPQSHSAHNTETACEAAVETWLRIRAFAGEFNSGREKAFEKLLPTLRGMDSGTDGFEQWARLSIGARLPVDLAPGAWYEKLAQLAAGAEVEPRGYAIPAWACEKNSALVRALLSGIRAAGGTPSFVYKTGTADLNIVAPAWRCPCAVYGPGDSALDHTPGEHIAIDEYIRAVDALSSALSSLVTNAKEAG
jgi:LysW-gamma-L-lysine carboxypeptidase